MCLRKWGFLACAITLAMPAFSLAAQQKALGLVNTSTNVKPTSAHNKFLLITDPTFSPQAVVDNPAEMIPTSGSLTDYFDPTQWQLNVDPNTGSFDLGGTVAGIDPFHVSSFTVQSLDGSLTVSDNGNGGDNYSTTGTFNSSQLTGYVTHINFYLPADVAAEVPGTPGAALTSDQDQNFYSLSLTAINNSDGNGFAETEGIPGDFVDFGPAAGSTGQTPETVPFTNIIASSVPEISSAGFLSFVGLTMFFGRRKAAKDLKTLKLLRSQTPPR